MASKTVGQQTVCTVCCPAFGSERVVLSQAYLQDNVAEFENILAQTMGIQEGSYRLLPVKIEEIDESLLPTRLRMLTTLDLTHPRRADREFQRLTRALTLPLPTR